MRCCASLGPSAPSCFGTSRYTAASVNFRARARSKKRDMDARGESGDSGSSALSCAAAEPSGASRAPVELDAGAARSLGAVFTNCAGAVEAAHTIATAAPNETPARQPPHARRSECNVIPMDYCNQAEPTTIGGLINIWFRSPAGRNATCRGADRGVIVLVTMETPSARTLPSIEDVLTFWFADPDRWWKKDPAFDATIRDRFLAPHDAIERDECDEWLETQRGALATVIVLDQFSRNMFRDSARMFASDRRALRTARRALDRGFDRGLSDNERMFLHMPFMHSEDIADQDRSVEFFGSALQDRKSVV